MDRDLDRLLKQVLKLPAGARAALAGRLIESLDDVQEISPEVEAQWSEEIARRLDELDSGAVKAVPWAQARKTILQSK